MRKFYEINLSWFAITSSTSLTGLIQTAYSRAVEFAFQPALYFAQFAQSKTWDARGGDPMPGNAVTFTIFSNLTAATGTLNETSDPTPESMGKTQVSISLSEWGKLVTTSSQIRVLSFADIDTAAARVVGDNMGNSVDLIARAAFDSSTASSYIKYASSGSVVNPTGVLDTANCRLKAADVRYARNRLARANVPRIDGQYYIAIVHPDVALDLRAETGMAMWRDPHSYSDPANIYNGEIGEFEGFRFIETSNAQLQANGASGSVDLYTSYFFGFQAVGYAVGLAPAMDISGPFDALQRLLNVYWYGLFGFGALRAESLFKVYSSSSVGA
jgi:N4-gp56 family major capsid protein